MGADLTLAEIVAEGERLEADVKAAKSEYCCTLADSLALNTACLRRDNWYLAHGPRLLAVARAAVEWDKADGKRLDARDAATAALRLAVRGDAAGEGKSE